MEFYFHFAAYLHAAIVAGLFYVHGYWLTALLLRNERRYLWAWTPLLGAAGQALLLTGLHYIGLPLAPAGIVALLISSGLGIWLWRKGRLPFAAWWERAEWPMFAVSASAVGLFLLPYFLYNAYPFFGDAFMYASISEWSRAHGYFASAEPAVLYPWQSMMKYAQHAHLPMGATATLAADAALLRQDSAVLFLPVTAAYFFVGLCGLRVLAARLLHDNRVASLVSLAAYGTNIAYVLMPLAINLLRQAAGTGYLFALTAVALDDDRSRAKSVLLGMLLAAGAIFYPEFLPFALVPLGITLVWQRRFHWRLWVFAAVVAFLLTPYGWIAAVQNLLFHWSAKPGSLAEQPLWSSALTLFNLRGGTVFHATAAMALSICVAAALSVAVVYGYRRLPVGARQYVLVAVGMYFLFGLYLGVIARYSYGFYKNLLFGYYLVPLCLASAVAALLQIPRGTLAGDGVRLALLLWAAVVLIPLIGFERSVYSLTSDGAYIGLLKAGRMLKSFQAIQPANNMVPPDQRTLLAITEEPIAKWLAYYFHRPLGVLYPGEYLKNAQTEPLPDSTEYRYVLTRNVETSLEDHAQVLLSNHLFTLSRAQTFVMFGKEGWSDREIAADEAVRWMGTRGELFAYAPTAREIRLSGVVSLPADRSSAPLHVQVNNITRQEGLLAAPEALWDSVPLLLRPGFNRIVLETDGEPHDAHRLRWRRLGLTRPVPPSLSLDRPADRERILGLTADQWVLADGVRFLLPHSSAKTLHLTGELLKRPEINPQVLEVSFEGSPAVSAEISHAGPFSLDIPLPPRTAPLNVSLKPRRTFSPSESGVSADPRRLGVRLLRIELR